MTQANSVHSTPPTDASAIEHPMFPPVDPTRRRFLAVTAAASAVSVGSLAAAAMPAIASQCDAEVVAAGIQFETLLAKYVPVWFEWARLHREAKEAAEAKFGEDGLDNPAWTEPLTGTAAAFLFQLQVNEKNGCTIAAALEFSLFEQMTPLANLIREAEVSSVAGLRAKALVAVLDFMPGVSEHDGNFSFDVAESSHYSLFAGAVALTGLGDFVGNIEKHLIADAGVTLRDSAPIVA